VAPKLIQLNYKFRGSRAEFEAANLPGAAALAALPGLRWQIWMMNEAAGEAGAIGMFDDEATRQAYIDGMQTDLTISEITYKLFDVLEAHSVITRGPFGHGVPV
jgi:hypothetical protein